jgi:ABC-2 type transport system permease protein
MSTLLGLTVANIRSLLRDRAALFWTFVFPIMFVLLFGMIFSGSSSTKFSVAVVDQDNSTYSAGIRAALDQVELFDIRTGSLEDERAAMQRGDVVAIIVIPSGTGDAVQAKTKVALQIYEDPTKTQTNQVVESVVGKIANYFNLGLAGGTEILTVESKTLESSGLTAAGYLVPSILAMALMQLGVFAAIPLVQQREKGILKRLGATPLARWKLVGSHVLERLIVAIIDAVLIIGIGMMLFDVQIVGNVLMVAFLVLLGATAFLAIGYALAAFLKTEDQAAGVVQVVQIPMMFLSGIFFSFEFLPGFLQTVARFLPLTYLADALRQEMVHGTQVAPMSIDIAILAGWTIVCLVISARFLRWE